VSHVSLTPRKSSQQAEVDSTMIYSIGCQYYEKPFIKMSIDILNNILNLPLQVVHALFDWCVYLNKMFSLKWFGQCFQCLAIWICALGSLQLCRLWEEFNSGYEFPLSWGWGWGSRCGSLDVNSKRETPTRILKMIFKIQTYTIKLFRRGRCHFK
jgi:hypothetical protein